MSLSDNDEDALLKELCKAANQNNAVQVASILKCRRKSSSPSIDEPLLCCSDQVVARLIQRVLSEDDEELLPEGTSLDQFVKVLLISPSIYETPWHVSCQFIKYIHRSQAIRHGCSMNIRSTVANIQSFLQQVVSNWWEEERKQLANNVQRRAVRPVEGEVLSKRNPRQWILELVSVVIDPLLETEGDIGNEAIQDIQLAMQNNNEHWTLPLELIATTVSLISDLEMSLLHSALDLLFQKRPIKSERILPWVNMASEIRLFLRDEDWSSVRMTLSKVLSQQPCPVHRQDLPRLAESIFSFCTTTPSLNLHWEVLILQLLSVAASSDMAVFSTVETALESCLTALPSSALMQWTASTANHTLAEKPQFKRSWIEANMLLLIMRSSLHSGSQLVSALVAQAFGRTENGKPSVSVSTSGKDLNSICWNRLVSLATGAKGASWLTTDESLHSTSSTTPSRSKGHSEGTTNPVRRIFERISYSGRGSFQGQDERTTATLTGISSLVNHSLFLELSSNVLQTCHLQYAMERAKAWIHCASEVIESRRESTQVVDLVVALVILITVYSEMPQTRSSIVRGMIQGFSADTILRADITDMAAVYALFIEVVLRWAPDRISSELDQVSDIFALPLPLAVFTDFAWALSPLPSARRALLSSAQKRLDKSLQYQLWSSVELFSRGTNGRYDKIRCGLLALLVLVGSGDWGDCEYEAWYLLSDIVVENQPPLPLPARTWLFQQLDNLVNKQRCLNSDAAKHVLCACLVRLLLYIGPDKNGDDIFSYDKVFVVRSGNDTRQVEDIVSLFEVTFALIHCVDPEDASKQAVLNECRASLLDLIQAEGSPLNQKPFDGNGGLQPSSTPLPTTDKNLPYYVAFYCLALALRAAKIGKTMFDGKDMPSQQIMQSVLVEWERQELRSASKSETLPSWLEPPSQICTLACRHWTSNVKHSVPVRLALYDMIVDLLLGPRSLSSFAANELLDRVSSRQISALFRIRRDLLDIYEGESEGTSIMPYSSLKLLDSFERFCPLVVPIVKQYITSFHDVAETDQLLSAVIDFCDVIQCAEKPHNDNGGSDILQQFLCLWEVYHEVCEEKAAVRLISFLEKLTDDERKKTFCGLPVRTHDDIDSAVRHVRLSIVRAISACSSHFLRLKQYHRNQPESYTGDEAGFQIPLKNLVEFIDTLVGDLNSGLQGESGCLTYDMFLSFVGCADDCAKMLIDNFSHNASESELLSVVTVCQRATVILERILCSFVLTQALTFKKTLSLCVERLPTLCRCVNRTRLLTKTVQMSQGANQRKRCVSSTILDQLTSVLRRKVELTATGAHWEEIAEGHLGDTEDADDMSVLSDDSGMKQDNGKRIPKHVSSENERKDKIVLRSERTWVWALCCVFQAFESNWEESQHLMRYSQDRFQSEQAMALYVERRTFELSENLHNLCFVLQTTKSQTDFDTTAEHCISVYALNFPTSAKTRLCSAIDCALVTLQASLKAISAFQAELDVTGANCQAFVEALCCISSWISMQTERLDLSSGVQRWYAIEKKASSHSRSQNEVYTAEAAVLRRLPKLVFRLEALELSARKLYETLRDMTKSADNSKKSAFLQRTDDLVSLNAETTGSGFVGLLSAKLKFLKQEQHMFESDFGMPSSGQKKRKNTADVAKRVQRERRRRVVRSRNGVIDKFLQLDKRLGDDEAQNTDAFADLEDFLVEG